MESGLVAAVRRPTRSVHVGSVEVGGDAPISVQSMTTTKTADVDGTLAQIYALAAAGCDIVRATCNDAAAAEGLARIVPPVAGTDRGGHPPSIQDGARRPRGGRALPAAEPRKHS